ncbi:hypothetical protein [Streptomyces canarius]
MRTSTHMLQAAHEAGVERYFYSSACVYAAAKQTDPKRHRRACRRARSPSPWRRCSSPVNPAA